MTRNLGEAFGKTAADDFMTGLTKTIARRKIIDRIGTGLPDSVLDDGDKFVQGGQRAASAVSGLGGQLGLLNWGAGLTDAERLGLVRMATEPADFTRLAPEMRQVPTGAPPLAYNPFGYFDLGKLGVPAQTMPAYQFPPKRVAK